MSKKLFLVLLLLSPMLFAEKTLVRGQLSGYVAISADGRYGLVGSTTDDVLVGRVYY